MLTGQAKIDYQREYMRNLRKNKESLKSGQKQGIKNALELTQLNEQRCVRPVRPLMLDPVRPAIKYPSRPDNISDNQWEMIKYKAEKEQAELNV
jgi:hypothetical protein